MGKRVKIELDRAGIKALLNSAEVAADVTRRAQAVAAAAGPGMEVETWTGFDRVHATVHTATREARRREATDRALTRALDAGRG